MRRKKGQSTLEYVLILSCIIAGLIAMRNYVQRSMQGNIKIRADGIGSQYNAGREEWDINTSQYSKSRQTKQEDGTSKSELIEDEVTLRWSN